MYLFRYLFLSTVISTFFIEITSLSWSSLYFFSYILEHISFLVPNQFCHNQPSASQHPLKRLQVFLGYPCVFLISWSIFPSLYPTSSVIINLLPSKLYPGDFSCSFFHKAYCWVLRVLSPSFLLSFGVNTISFSNIFNCLNPHNSLLGHLKSLPFYH